MQWTVDDLDSGGGLMTNENKSLAFESDGDVFVGTIPSLGPLMGGTGKVPLVRKRNLIFFFKSRFSIFF